MTVIWSHPILRALKSFIGILLRRKSTRNGGFQKEHKNSGLRYWVHGKVRIWRNYKTKLLPGNVWCWLVGFLLKEFRATHEKNIICIYLRFSDATGITRRELLTASNLTSKITDGRRPREGNNGQIGTWDTRSRVCNKQSLPIFWVTAFYAFTRSRSADCGPVRIKHPTAATRTWKKKHGVRIHVLKHACSAA